LNPDWFFAAFSGRLSNMDISERLLAVDKHLSEPHRILTAIATGKVLDTRDVHAAIAEITAARDLLHDGAEPAPEN
jgi:hypothetical protein